MNPEVAVSPDGARRLVDLLAGPERAWQRYANCAGVDSDLFFPDRGASTREAKAVCAGCAVRDDCLEYALANGDKFGIWGGLSERERRPMRSHRQRVRAHGTRLRYWTCVDGRNGGPCDPCTVAHNRAVHNLTERSRAAALRPPRQTS